MAARVLSQMPGLFRPGACMTTTSFLGTEPKAATPRLNYAKAAPAVLQAMLALQATVNASGLDETLLNLVKLRASQINGCAFCIDMHVREAKALGETDERLYLLDAWREVDVYTAREQAALHWTEVLTRLAGTHVTEADFATAR